MGTGEKRTELWVCSVVSSRLCCGLPLHTVTESDGDQTENILPKETGLMPPNITGHMNKCLCLVPEPVVWQEAS